jgi:hypothetical protein
MRDPARRLATSARSAPRMASSRRPTRASAKAWLASAIAVKAVCPSESVALTASVLRLNASGNRACSSSRLTRFM